MAAEDWIPDYDPDDEPEEQRCRLCGERDLWWDNRSGRWILVDGEGRAHAPHCKGRVAKKTEFPNLEAES